MGIERKVFTKEEAEQLYEERLAQQLSGQPYYFCNDSISWLVAHPTLADAWEACDRPAWLQWWLHGHLGMRMGPMGLHVLDEIREAVGYEIGLDDNRIDVGACDIIRAMFTYWGERRR